jgi:hypothetical protein
MSMRSLLLSFLLVVILVATTGCVRVKPWERDLLSRRDMAWEPDGLEAKRESHIYFSKEASMPGGAGGGGGCGCN